MTHAPPHEPATAPLPRANVGCGDTLGLEAPGARDDRPAPRPASRRGALVPQARPPGRWIAFSVGLHLAVGAGTWWFVGVPPTRPQRLPTQIAATIAAPSEARVAPAPPDPTEPVLEALHEPPPLPEREQVVADFEVPPAEPESLPESVAHVECPWLPGLELAVRPPSRPTPRDAAPLPLPARPGPPPPDVVPTRAASTVPATPTPLTGNAPPVYPASAARQGQHGRVVLRLWVTASGEVERVDVLQSSGWPLLDAEALRALRAWRFAPRPPGPPTPAQPFHQAIRFAAPGT